MINLKHRTSPDVILLQVDSPTLEGQDLSEAYLRRVAMAGMRCRAVDLRRADLRGADLRGTDLRNALLAGARLCEADLRRANLAGAGLAGADLRGCNLRRADLRGADLRDANLEGARLLGVRWDRNTRWPDGFTATWRVIGAPGSRWLLIDWPASDRSDQPRRPAFAAALATLTVIAMAGVAALSEATLERAVRRLPTTVSPVVRSRPPAPSRQARHIPKPAPTLWKSPRPLPPSENVTAPRPAKREGDPPAPATAGAPRRMVAAPVVRPVPAVKSPARRRRKTADPGPKPTVTPARSGGVRLAAYPGARGGSVRRASLELRERATVESPPPPAAPAEAAPIPERSPNPEARPAPTVVVVRLPGSEPRTVRRAWGNEEFHYGSGYDIYTMRRGSE